MSKLEGKEALPIVVHGKETELTHVALPIKVDSDGKIVVSETGMPIPEHDEVTVGRTSDLITSVVYKKDSSTVATLTITRSSGLVSGWSIA